MEATLKYAEHKLDEAINQGEPDETIAYWRGYRDCAKALEKDHFPDTTKMVPLTMEQLRGMDGQPVWVEDKQMPELSGWGIMRDDVCDGYHGVCFIEEYGKRWIAYAYHPAHIDRGAWVSVKERLPEKDGWYLVYAPGYWGNSRIYGLDGMAYSNFKHNYKEHWGIERGTSKGWAGIVTHWMPLPEPPAELEKRVRG